MKKLLLLAALTSLQSFAGYRPRATVSGSGTTTVTATGSTPTKGSVTTDSIRWARDGRYLHIVINMNMSSSGGNAGSGEYLWLIPGGLSADTAWVPTLSSSLEGSASRDAMAPSWIESFFVGHQPGGNSSWNGHAILYDATHFKIVYRGEYNAGFTPILGVIGQNSYPFSGNFRMSGWARIPISGWTD